jgi:O-acetyl-ADP-ribose deacetylase (regulator of RNase III)
VCRGQPEPAQLATAQWSARWRGWRQGRTRSAERGDPHSRALRGRLGRVRGWPARWREGDVVPAVQTEPMGLTAVTGDLFEFGLPAVGHGCNCVGAMGAGIAREFRRRFPQMYREYRRRCQTGEFQLGDVFVWQADDLLVYNLATQPVPRPSATLDAINASVRAALADLEQRGVPRLGVPRIGAGLGGLAWPDVAAVLDAAADDSTVDLVVVSLPI